MGNQQQPSQGTSTGSKNFGNDPQKGNKGSQPAGGQQGSHTAGSGSTTGDPGRTPQKDGNANTMNNSQQSGEGRQSSQKSDGE